jgi:hypothetical protein
MQPALPQRLDGESSQACSIAWSMDWRVEPQSKLRRRWLAQFYPEHVVTIRKGPSVARGLQFLIGHFSHGRLCRYWHTLFHRAGATRGDPHEPSW